MKIYTKTGDKGTTRLVDGSCVTKHHPRVEAYGTVDELNSHLGLIQSHLNKVQSINVNQTTHASLQTYFNKIQNDLFIIGSLLATEKEDVRSKLPQLKEEDIQTIESIIDDMTSTLQPLNHFILPTGHEIASLVHIARTICRRAERRVSEITTEHQDQDLSLKYLNRLSDFLFTAARYLNSYFNIQDVPWKKK